MSNLNGIVGRTVVSTGVLAALLFGPARTLAWPAAWAYLILFDCCSLAFAFWLQRVDPALLAERMTSPLAAGQKPRDRAIMAGLLLVFCAWYVVIALDARVFRWSHVPPWAQGLGAVLVVASFLGWMAVMRANSFAAPSIRLQTERGQRVVDTGPYALIRHPMYAYAVPSMIGTPLLLGSFWGLSGLIGLLPLLIARIFGEEALLRDGLPGYQDYAARVRYRLLPGIW